MNAGASLGVGRLAPSGREELRRQLLALVLAFVLVWYTFVVPAQASARSPRSFRPDDDGSDGEVRGLGARREKQESRSVDDLDWPEYIYP
jgi:hypothetical protein